MVNKICKIFSFLCVVIVGKLCTNCLDPYTCAVHVSYSAELGVKLQHIIFLSHVCSCQTVKTKEEKEVLEHFAGMVCQVYVCTVVQGRISQILPG